MKYKVGDRVKVVRASTLDERDRWGDSWVPNMDRFIGRWCIISGISTFRKNTCRLYTEGDNVHQRLNFPLFVLIKMEVGQQLEFDFMKE